MDLKKLPERPAFENPPRRWVAERTFAWISHNRGMAEDHERPRSTGEAFIPAAMARLMARRLARNREFSDGLGRFPEVLFHRERDPYGTLTRRDKPRTRAGHNREK